ncbi:MOSC domain-containing protein (plasmid) [Coraliomargarita sp. W4R53]
MRTEFGAVSGYRFEMQITRLRVYPIKSFAGNDVESAKVLPWGLEHDRRWALVSPDGEPVTAREANGLLGLSASPQPGGDLLLRDRDGATLNVAVPTDATPIDVGHSRQGAALPAGLDADTWLTSRIERSVRLVWQPDPHARVMDPSDGGNPGDHVSLADVGPLLLTSESSLAQLDRWSEPTTPPFDMLRFRPNIVVDGVFDEPFAEDHWPFVQIGDARFRVSGTCDRCVMTTIDPKSLERGKEPIRTLAKHRRWDGKTFFGVWLVPQLAGVQTDIVLNLGDAVVPD